jgi:DnaK suppressor protein
MSQGSKNLPADEYLNPTQVLELHDLLNEQLVSLLEQSRERVKEVTQHREVDADALDLAVSETNRDQALRMADRERRLLKKVRYAMDRMRHGEFGACETCGEEISYPRLLARPVATLCIDCKTEAEQLERGRFV